MIFKRPEPSREKINTYKKCTATAQNKAVEPEKAPAFQPPAVVFKAQLKAPAQQLVIKGTAVVFNVKQCPCCKKQTMETLMRFHRGGPPPDWKTLATDLLACIRGASATP